MSYTGSDIVEQLRAIRRAKGLRQADVATRMHCSPCNVTKFELECLDGTRSPSIDMLTRYAEAIGAQLTIGITA